MELVPAAEVAELRRDWLAPRRDCRDAADDVSVLGAATGVGTDVVDGLLLELAEVVRPSTGGVETRGVPGFEDLGVFGLDQDVKKSSSAGSSVTVTDGSIPSTKIPVGKLQDLSVVRKESIRYKYPPNSIVLNATSQLFPVQFGNFTRVLFLSIGITQK